MDIALATESRAMYAHMLGAKGCQKARELASTDELVALLRRSPAWDTAMLRLPADDIDDKQFAHALDHRLYEDLERLYRSAFDESKEYLSFMTLEVELQCILAALRRLTSPVESEFEAPLPPQMQLLPGYNIDKLTKAKSLADILEVASKGIFGETLRALQLDPKTGLPVFADAALELENQFYRKLGEYLENVYDGSAKKELIESIGLRADMLNISYILRLRRFNTSVDEAMRQMLPLHGTIGPEAQRRILKAKSDDEAIAAIRHTRGGKWIHNAANMPPEELVREAKRSYYREVMHGTPNLAVVDAFLRLKEDEADTLKRVFVSLKYSIRPTQYTN